MYRVIHTNNEKIKLPALIVPYSSRQRRGRIIGQNNDGLHLGNADPKFCITVRGLDIRHSYRATSHAPKVELVTVSSW